MSRAFFALLIAGLTLLQTAPVCTAQVAVHSFQRDPLASAELEILSVDPVIFASDTFILNIHGRYNYEGVLAMVLITALGAGAMYTDFLAFAEEERLKQKVAKVGSAVPKAELPTSPSIESWPMLPTAVIIVILSIIAAASLPVLDHASVPSQRSQAAMPIFSHPMESLHHVKGMDRPPDTLVGDALTVAFILASMLIGSFMMHADVGDMVKEEEQAEKKTKKASAGKTVKTK
jgi:hypothetical protein